MRHGHNTRNQKNSGKHLNTIIEPPVVLHQDLGYLNQSSKNQNICFSGG